MLLALTLSLLLNADPVEPEAPNRRDREHVQLIGLGAGAVLISAGSALGAWVDRDGTFGRVSAVTAGTLGTALLSASLGAFIASRVYLARANASSVAELASDLLEYSVGVALASIVSGLVGLGVGALVSGFATGPPGTPRGVFGIASGSVLAATGITVLIVAW